MIHDLTGWHLLNVLAVILLLFGAVEAPTLAATRRRRADATMRPYVRATKRSVVP